MDTQENGISVSSNKSNNRLMILLAFMMALLFVAGGILITNAYYRITDLETEIKNLKAPVPDHVKRPFLTPEMRAALTAPASAPIDGGTVAVTVAPAAPVVETAPDPEPEEPIGKWAVRLHALYSVNQIKTEKREVQPAFETCGEDTIISLCVVKVKGQRKAMASLVMSPRGMSSEDAKKMASCFNRSMDIVGQENQAEAVLLEDFEDACVLGPDDAQ